MDKYEAAKLLGVTQSASPENIELAFENARHSIEKKVAQAPTPALKQKLRTKRNELEAAFKTLTAMDSDEAPSISPKATKHKPHSLRSVTPNIIEREKSDEKSSKNALLKLHPDDRINIKSRLIPILLIVFLLCLFITMYLLFSELNVLPHYEMYASYSVSILLVYPCTLYYLFFVERAKSSIYVFVVFTLPLILLFTLLASYGLTQILASYSYVLTQIGVAQEEIVVPFAVGFVLITIVRSFYVFYSLNKGRSLKRVISSLLLTFLSFIMLPKWFFQSISYLFKSISRNA